VHDVFATFISGIKIAKCGVKAIILHITIFKDDSQFVNLAVSQTFLQDKRVLLYSTSVLQVHIVHCGSSRAQYSDVLTLRTIQNTSRSGFIRYTTRGENRVSYI
jgi:hypothetical protein